MHNVRLAMYKGKGGPGNALIRYWTKSPYSHCEIVLDDLAYSSSLMDGGVRAKKIDLNNGKWDVMPVPWANDFDVLSHYHKTYHHSYGWIDLIFSQILNRARDLSKSAFCSEWCAAALGIPNPTLYSPKTLFELIHYLNSKRS